MKALPNRLILAVFLAAMLVACNNQASIKQEQETLLSEAQRINRDFKGIRLEVEHLAVEIKQLYENQDRILPTIDKTKYQLTGNGVFTKPIDDGGSAVYVSGYVPVTDAIKNIVFFTEPIDSIFKDLEAKYPEIAQVYFNDPNSYNRIYPFFDVLLQYEAKMEIPSFNFYYLADQKHNPSRKSLWVHEPYVDPAGRGWMVSAIAPVYYKDCLVGVSGIDVTISMLTKRFIQDNLNEEVLIIDNKGTIVSAQEKTIKLLSFPPLFEYKYIETIKQDTYRKEQYNLMLSKDAQVRNLAIDILINKKSVHQMDLAGEKIAVIASHIPELDWYLLKILK